ncbi:MAG: hypothetical protein ACUVX8_01790 [Candidatus Zipacnadales bacterium]
MMSAHWPVLSASISLALSALFQPTIAQSILQQLQAARKPVFRVGHTLPPLTRWGWTMPYEVRLELCEHWGYALEFGGYVTAEIAARLDDPQSLESKLCALAASNPQRYPLFVLTHRALDNPVGDPWCRDENGALIDGQKVWSPEAPDAVFEEAAERMAAPLRKVRQKAPIAIILNGGEYALSVYGHHGKVWERDPKVRAAKGDRDWFDYISERKTYQEMFITRACQAAVPDRLLYLYYPTEGCPHANRYKGWDVWAIDYRYFRTVSDIPNTSIYYKHFNDGWTGANDMLTQALNATGQQIALGDPLSYNWVNAGWPRENLGEAAVGDPAHYMGYLKCYYTAGMIGGVAGYFSYPKEDDPHWLWQMTVLSHCHALFSHLEDFLRNGDLLPGPERHRWSKDQPAYEFSTGDPDVRAVARKHRDREEWLVTVWAAAGEEREVKVMLPELGKLSLTARPCGSVYRAKSEQGKPVLALVDEDGMEPTCSWRGTAK